MGNSLKCEICSFISLLICRRESVVDIKWGKEKAILRQRIEIL